MKEPRSEKRLEHGLDEARISEVGAFVGSDPEAIRFFLFFDALRLRKVEPAQAARTAHLIVSEKELDV